MRGKPDKEFEVAGLPAFPKKRTKKCFEHGYSNLKKLNKSTTTILL